MSGQAAETREPKVNGVDVGAVESTVKALGEKPDLANSKFRAHNTWIDGGHNRSTINAFYGAGQENYRSKAFMLDADEPPLLAGEDRGANPVEYLLHALAACMTTTMVYHAAIRGINLEEVESELEGDIDLRGFLGLSNEVRRGYEEIRVNFKVKTDAENVEKLKAFSRLSPVYDVVSKGTRVKVKIERK
jgi:uncharacterized OsmC-like protein